MKTTYIEPAMQIHLLSAGTIIANSITGATVDGEELNIDNQTTNGDASGALVKGYSVWDDDWNE